MPGPDFLRTTSTLGETHYLLGRGFLRTTIWAATEAAQTFSFPQCYQQLSGGEGGG